MGMGSVCVSLTAPEGVRAEGIAPFAGPLAEGAQGHGSYLESDGQLSKRKGGGWGQNSCCLPLYSEHCVTFDTPTPTT